MSVLFITGLILIVVFSFSVSAYLTYYKFNINHMAGKAITFILLGTLVSVVTFTISLSLIWPPVM